MPGTITAIHLGQPTAKIHVDSRAHQGKVEFDAFEDYILYFNNPNFFGINMASVKAGVPLSLDVQVNKGTTTYWVARATDVATMVPNATGTTSLSAMSAAPVAGSPNDITVP